MGIAGRRGFCAISMKQLEALPPTGSIRTCAGLVKLVRRAEFDWCRVHNGQRRLGDGEVSWGGACTAGVVLSDEQIDYPMPEKLVA